MLDIVIENMTIDDLDQIEEVELLSFAIPWPRQSFYDELNNHLATCIVAKHDNRVIGYAGMWRIIDEGHITNIAVHPDFRGKSVATALIFKLIEIAKAHDIVSLTLEVRKSNIAAQKLYEKHGFYSAGLRKAYYSDNKEDAIIMWKEGL